MGDIGQDYRISAKYAKKRRIEKNERIKRTNKGFTSKSDLKKGKQYLIEEALDQYQHSHEYFYAGSHKETFLDLERQKLELKLEKFFKKGE